MDRSLFGPEHTLFRDTVRTFVRHEIAPFFDQWESAGRVDRDLYRKAGAAGLLGFAIPEAYGGGGTADCRYEAILQEEIATSGMLSAGQGILNHHVAVQYVLRLGTDEQRRRWLPGLARGDLLGTVAMTEPGAGSDLNAVATRAVAAGDDFVLSGAKTFISSAMLSDLVVVVCKIGTDAGARPGLSLLVVEDGMPGFARGRNLRKIGQHAADTGELFFGDVRVPRANLLGEQGRGFYHLVANLPSERLGIAVAAVALSQAAFDWTLAYTRQRKAFGQPVASFQHNRFLLATMRTELDIAQVYVDRLLEAMNEAALSAEQAAEAKWWCTDLARRTIDQCLQLHGGYGYMEEYPIARAWRDSRVMSIYGGTNEIMKDLIGRRMLGV
jgi:alkylation response protein AidB-like acyl-CoA dehydrogenase